MHQCLNCKKIYSDEEVPIVEGCSCGGHLFLYVKGEEAPDISEKAEKEIFEKIEKIDQEKKKDRRKEKIEERLKKGEEEIKEEEFEKEEITKLEPKREEKKKEFGFETVKIEDAGVYEINIKALMRGRPMVVLSKGGSYVINLPSAFGDKESEEIKAED